MGIEIGRKVPITVYHVPGVNGVETRAFLLQVLAQFARSSILDLTSPFDWHILIPLAVNSRLEAFLDRGQIHTPDLLGLSLPVPDWIDILHHGPGLEGV